MSDLDNLEYSVKFPSTTSASNGGSTSENDYVFVVAEDKIPVIVLFGWAGCRDKYLAKYSQIYEEKGLITLRYITPNKYLFWKHYEMVTIGEKLVRLLSDLNFDTHPIILHVFSNGGACAYQNFSKALERSSKPLQIKGAIFDSTPGRRRVYTLFKAVSAIFGGNIIYNYSISFVITMFVTIMWVIEHLCDMVKPKKVGASDIIQYLKVEKNRWPQHCIYSKADDLIPYQDIEEFLDARKKLGIEVSSLRFDDSPHVKHYIHNKDSYVNSVYSFINKCLNGYN